MVGLRLKAGLVAKEGDPLYGQEENEGVVPWAAALSDALLASNCAACFEACTPPPSRFPCQGPCQGALTYCSLSCRDLDFSLHSRSGECRLLSLLQSPVSTSSKSSLFLDLPDESSLHKRSNFPSLGGTCDLRAALRLLAHHEAFNHIAPFLAASGSHLHNVEYPRLGGLLSNRCTLLQPTTSDEVDRTPELEEEETLIATELREAALLVHNARYSTSLNACMGYTSKHNEGMSHVPDTHTDVCMTGSLCSFKNAQGHVNAYTDICMTTTGHASITSENAHVGSKHVNTTHRNVKDVYMRHLGTHETTDGSIDTHKDVYIATSGHHNTHEAMLADVAATSMASMTLAEELLLVEEVICQVFTNGVRIQVDTWSSDGHSHVWLDDLGTAVYGPLLSWINHSCRPNAFYSFVLAGPTTLKSTLKVPLVPDRDVKGVEDAWGLKASYFPWFKRGLRHYGPRACLRAIGNIKGLEPVCISYVDLLQPKNTRRQELWMKYRFNCICERCEVNPTNSVDAILQNIGFPGMSTLEDWLHEEAQRGLSEFLNNDDPLSCCKIMEDALIRVLHEAYQNWLGGSALPGYVTKLESFNYSGGISFSAHNSCSEISERHGVQLNLHLMHHLCLDVYSALSSSYKVLATGLNSLRMYKVNGIEEIKEAESSLASAVYTLILAATIQYMYDYGEPGILGIAARSWLQTGEAFVSLILKLDSYFFLNDTLEMQKLFFQLSGDCNEPMVFFCEKEFLDKLKKVLTAHGRIFEAIHPCASTIDVLRCVFTSVWPVLRKASRFLSHIETPFDISRVFFGSSEKQTHILESKDVWICHRAEAFVGALCSFQHGLKLMNICYGFSEKRIVAMRDFVSSCFHKKSYYPEQQNVIS